MITTHGTATSRLRVGVICSGTPSAHPWVDTPERLAARQQLEGLGHLEVFSGTHAVRHARRAMLYSADMPQQRTLSMAYLGLHAVGELLDFLEEGASHYAEEAAAQAQGD